MRFWSDVINCDKRDQSSVRSDRRCMETAIQAGRAREGNNIWWLCRTRTDVQWRVTDTCWVLANSIWLPCLLGWIPSPLKSRARSQNKFKLSLKSILWDQDVDWSRLRMQPKLSAPQAGGVQESTSGTLEASLGRTGYYTIITERNFTCVGVATGNETDDQW